MNTVIMRWHQATSNYTQQQFEQDMLIVNEGSTIDLNWQVDGDAPLNEDDRFYIIADDINGNSSICMSGYFCSEKFDSDSGTRISLDPLNMENPVVSDAVTLAQLQKAIPSVDWENTPTVFTLSEGETKIIEELWLEHIFDKRDDFDGQKMAKSWLFDLEKFETVTPPLQIRYKRRYGAVCERCHAKESNTCEVAYHVVLTPEVTNLRSALHCLCQDCWFSPTPALSNREGVANAK